MTASQRRLLTSSRATMRDFVTQTTFIKKKLLATQNDIFLVPVKQFGAEIRKKKISKYPNVYKTSETIFPPTVS